MKYNEKVERFAPKLGRKNLVNGLSCTPFVYMDYSEYGMWVHYVKYCENIAKHKYKRCLKIADRCFESREYWRYRYGDWNDKGYDRTYKWRKVEFWGSWGRRWLELAEKFKHNSTAQ